MGIIVRLLLLLSSYRLSYGQQVCTSNELRAYMNCVENNPCVCSNCDPDPLDDVPEIVLEQPPTTCQEISRIFCPLIRCCSECTEEAAAFYACNFRDFSLAQLGQECPQNCNSFPLLDGTCAPTIAPSDAGMTQEPTTVQVGEGPTSLPVSTTPTTAVSPTTSVLEPTPTVTNVSEPATPTASPPTSTDAGAPTFPAAGTSDSVRWTLARWMVAAPLLLAALVV